MKFQYGKTARTLKTTGALTALILTLNGLGTTFCGGVAFGQEPGRSEQAETLQSILVEMREASRVWERKVQAATTKTERLDLIRRFPQWDYETRVLEFARRRPNGPGAIAAAKWLAKNGNAGPVLDSILAMMREHHVENARMSDLCRILAARTWSWPSREIEPLLIAIAENNPRHNVQGVAYLSLARYLQVFWHLKLVSHENGHRQLKSQQDLFSEEYIDWFIQTDAEKLAIRIDELSQKVIDGYADVPDDKVVTIKGSQPRYANAAPVDKGGKSLPDARPVYFGQRPSLADTALGIWYSMHSEGSMALGVDGSLSDGTEFSLNDLRGQVVVLMFSADWCVPCKAMYGQLRQLSLAFADHPFVVVTVMADRSVETVEKAIEYNEVTWPAVWDGEDGPIADAWHRIGFGAPYVIDRDGRISSMGFRGRDLERDVEELLGITVDDAAAQAGISKEALQAAIQPRRLSLKKMNIAGAALVEKLADHREVRVLDLSENPITDDDLVHLKDLTELREIELAYTGVTDAGLIHIRDLPNLKILGLSVLPDVEGTTRLGRLALAKAIPGLQVMFVTHPPQE